MITNFHYSSLFIFVFILFFFLSNLSIYSLSFFHFSVPPRVLINTDNPLGVVNQSVTLTFSIVDASPQVILDNIQWMFNDTVINNFTEPLLLEHIFSPDLLSLTLTNVQHSDQGYYSLTATNEAGTNTASIFLEVEGNVLIFLFDNFELCKRNKQVL